MMTDTPKLLTEASAEMLLKTYSHGQILAELRERGLIAPEPVDVLEKQLHAEAQKFGGDYWDDVYDTAPDMALAALKRGMELEREARPPLTREMVRDALFGAFMTADKPAEYGMDWADVGPSLETSKGSALIDALHTTLTKALGHD